jgi:hypothetical protein
VKSTFQFFFSEDSTSILQLVNAETHEKVVIVHRKRGSWNGEPRDLSLEVSGEVVLFLDMVLLTFLIVECL